MCAAKACSSFLRLGSWLSDSCSTRSTQGAGVFAVSGCCINWLCSSSSRAKAVMPPSRHKVCASAYQASPSSVGTRRRAVLGASPLSAAFGAGRAWGAGDGSGWWRTGNTRSADAWLAAAGMGWAGCRAGALAALAVVLVAGVASAGASSQGGMLLSAAAADAVVTGRADAVAFSVGFAVRGASACAGGVGAAGGCVTAGAASGWGVGAACAAWDAGGADTATDAATASAAVFSVFFSAGGLKASRRSSTILKPAYSSGARPNSSRPWMQMLYSSWVSSAGRMLARRAISAASGSVSSIGMPGTACCTAMRCRIRAMSSSVLAAESPCSCSTCTPAMSCAALPSASAAISPSTWLLPTLPSICRTAASCTPWPPAKAMA